jgi:hypothetical protein
MNRNSTARKVTMHTSVAGKLTWKTIRNLMITAALCIPPYGGVIDAQGPAKLSKPAQPQEMLVTVKMADSDKCAPPQSGASSQCSNSCTACCPGRDAVCISQDPKIADAQINAQKAAAKDAAEISTIQTKAKIEADKEAAKNADERDRSQMAAAKQDGENAAGVFWWVFRSTGILLVLILLAITIGLVKGDWSLREALSEKSPVQPNRDNVETLPSASRFIALIGMAGILTILLGIGYAIIWNMLIYHKPPDSLSEIDSFLLAAASLFTPYIANQLRAAFQTPPDKTEADANAAHKPAAGA